MAIGLRDLGSEGEDELQHEINVTPFIDVMLVLLIIFMVAAPLSTVDVVVDLPQSTAEPEPRPDKPLSLTLKVDGTLLLGTESVAPDGLAAALDEASGGDREARVYLGADKGVAYGEVIAVTNRLRAAGYLKLGLVGLEAATAERTP